MKCNLATALAIIAMSCGAASPEDTRANAVLDWNEIMVQTTATQNPFAQARLAAITQLAVFEATNAISREYEPYLGTIDAPRGASVEAAAVAEAHRVLVHYFPSNAATLDAERAKSLAAILNGKAKDSGIAVGEAAAQALIAARANDGSAPPQFHMPVSTAPGEWQTTQGCPPAGGILFHWRSVVPFGIESSSQFRSAPPPRLTSRRYTDDFKEVKRVGSADSGARSQDRADVANFYNVVLAVGTWNPVARELAALHPRSLTSDARTLALLNMAISDGLVTVMETKYHYRFWRPETAIPAADADGNRKTEADADFKPFLPTPCFPSYPSAHASASYAARTVLEELYGSRPLLVNLSTPALPDINLRYTKLSDITDDIDDARVYGGIHFRFDQEEGAVQGRKIGCYVLKHNLRSHDGPHSKLWWHGAKRDKKKGPCRGH
jgi:hypothetical protein